MNSLICSAIRSRQVVRFYYKGGFRMVEPFCHGISLLGNEVLKGYQIDGHSESGNARDWKIFQVAEMSNLEVSAERFDEVRPHYNPYDLEISKIHCNI